MLNVELPFICKQIIFISDMIWTDRDKKYSRQTRK